MNSHSILFTFYRRSHILIFCHFFLIAGLISSAAAQTRRNAGPVTICNPIDLNYRFCLDKPSRREAADPAVINFKGEYYLFASKSGGYWHSTNLARWDLITTSDLPLEDYAPTAVVIADTVYFMASSGAGPTKIYKTTDPKQGKWAVANPAFPIKMTDPDLFLDDDGRLYFYYGCSNRDPIYAVELDKKTLMPISTPVACFKGNASDHGWERSGDYNEKIQAPWIEGAWMTKYNGKYYLQYACPATELKSYADGLYISDRPLGPFHLAVDNPFSSKPEGFIAGAGHSTTFKDNYGNFWRISSMTISVKHRYERRLGLFPAFFGPSEQAYTYTGFGDLPFYIPKKKIGSPSELSPKWMLLSYGRQVKTSSALDGHPAGNAADENVRTFWSAATGKPGEWISMDLGRVCRINAVQLNFAEHDTDIYGRSDSIYNTYKLEYSADGRAWTRLMGRFKPERDAPHAYIEAAGRVHARYIRVTNEHVSGGKFAMWDLRVFGNAGGKLPAQVNQLRLTRELSDPCQVELKWPKAKNTVGYNIRYGISPGVLNHSYQVLGHNEVMIRSLSRNSAYYFTIDAFNENGVTKGPKPVFLNK